jgi:hypothetical protein
MSGSGMLLLDERPTRAVPAWPADVDLAKRQPQRRSPATVQKRDSRLLRGLMRILQAIQDWRRAEARRQMQRYHELTCGVADREDPA